MDARSRADRRKIADLEHELTTIKRQIADRPASALPPLPIEVREPEAQEPAPEDAGTQGPAMDPEVGEVVGVDDDGTEIVYVGDAARNESVRPRQPRSWSTPASRSSRTAISSRTSRTSRSGPASPPTIESQMAEARQEQLPVTDRVGPTVDRWVGDDAGATRAPVVQDKPARRMAARRAPRPKRPPSSPPPAPTPAAANDLRVEYARALESLRGGDHAAAIDGFRAFVARHPAHDLTDNAQYWLGEALYDQRLYRDALLEFRKVVDNHPRGNKVPDALLKIGYTHAALGKPAEARAALELVMSMFPKSKPAALAARRIEALADE